jgi:hypothetical protein
MRDMSNFYLHCPLYMPGMRIYEAIHCAVTCLEDVVVAEVRLALGNILPGSGAVAPALALKLLV